MSEMIFLTVVAALVAGGLYARSVLELNWPSSLSRLHSAE
jgi:hypothetical protein